MVFITVAIFVDEYKLWDSSLTRFLRSSVTSLFWSPRIPLSKDLRLIKLLSHWQWNLQNSWKSLAVNLSICLWTSSYRVLFFGLHDEPFWWLWHSCLTAFDSAAETEFMDTDRCFESKVLSYKIQVLLLSFWIIMALESRTLREGSVIYDTRSHLIVVWQWSLSLAVVPVDLPSHPREESSSGSKSTRRLIKVDFSKLQVSLCSRQKF
jgi:hypothetical protein